MKFLQTMLVAALAGQAVASWGLSKAAYNKWHETELERWLSDHDIPYSKPADRKDLEKLVNDNWQTRVVDSYKSWDAPQLQSYLSDSGAKIDEKRKDNSNWLLENVKKSWHETEKSAETAYSDVKNWIFDSWTESQLKSFLDRHGIPNPNPRTRDTLLSTARDNYQSIATKLDETASYPGNWLYESWSDSDLKAWLDARGYPVPQPSTRDKLIANVRRNSRLASVKGQKVTDKLNEAKNTVSDTIFDTWSESSLKEFLDKNNVKVPQGSTKNELLALARRNKNYLTQGPSSVSSAFNSATSVAGDKVSSATDTAAYYSQASFDELINQWSDTRLKAYLDSRGVPVPQSGKRDELLAKVRLNKHKAANGFGAWTFDTWTYDNLKSWLESQGQEVSSRTATNRDALYNQAASYYNGAASSASSASSVAAKSASSASSAAAKSAGSAGSQASGAAGNAASKVSGAAGDAAAKATDAAGGAAAAATNAAGDAFATLTSAMAQGTQSAKDAAFDTWSDSDLKSYLDTYGIKTYQGTTKNELVAMARRNAHYFRHGSQDQGLSGNAWSYVDAFKNKIFDAIGWSGKKVQEGARKGKQEL